MAQTPVTLKVTDFADREVMLVNYKFNQETDIEGQLVGIPRGGFVKIRVQAMNDGNNQLIQWMLAPNDARDMEIAFEKTTDGSAMKSIKGTGCYCVNYVEKWEEGKGHYEEILVVCQNLENGGVKYENAWK